MPFLPSNLVWGAAFGLTAAAVGWQWWEAALMSVFSWSALAQFVALGERANAWMAAVAALLVSLRVMPMTIALHDWVRPMKTIPRLATGWAIAEPTFALLLRRSDERSGAYLGGAWAILYASWVGGTVLGAVLHRALPESWIALAGGLVTVVFVALCADALDSPDRILLGVIGGLAIVAALLLAGELGWVPRAVGSGSVTGFAAPPLLIVATASGVAAAKVAASQVAALPLPAGLHAAMSGLPFAVLGGITAQALVESMQGSAAPGVLALVYGVSAGFGFLVRRPFLTIVLGGAGLAIGHLACGL